MITAGVEFLTFVAKSGGSVLAPVSRFTRNAFQLEYLCWMAMKTNIYIYINKYLKNDNYFYSAMAQSHYLNCKETS